MKIAYPHLLNFFKEKPSLEELSDKLLQLGHEHEIEGDIIDLEITPNRGDCLSLKGIARDLNYFYKAELDRNTYDKNIPKSDLSFQNKAKDLCPNISYNSLIVEFCGKQWITHTLPTYAVRFQNKTQKKNVFKPMTTKGHIT